MLDHLDILESNQRRVNRFKAKPMNTLVQMFDREKLFKTYHYHPYPTSLRSINVVLSVNTSGYRCSPVVVQIVVQLAISCSEFQRF